MRDEGNVESARRGDLLPNEGGVGSAGLRTV